MIGTKKITVTYTLMKSAENRHKVERIAPQIKRAQEGSLTASTPQSVDKGKPNQKAEAAADRYDPKAGPLAWHLE